MSVPPAPPHPRLSGRDWLTIALAMAMAAAVLEFRLGWQDYWWDEHVSLMFTRSGWRELMVTYWGLDTHRPVYYGLQKAWNAVFGESTVAVRSLPVFLTVLIVPVFFAAARRIMAGPYAAIAAILLASAPMFIAQGREVRMYCLANLSLALALWLAVILATRAREEMRDGRPAAPGTARLWAGFAAAMALAFHAQALGIFVAALFGLWVLICVALGILPRRFLWQSLAAAGLYLVLILPALQPFFAHAGGTVGGSFWVPEPTPGYVYNQTTAAYPYPKWSKPVIGLMLLWGLWSLRSRPHIAWLLGMMMIGLPALVLAASFVKPLYMARVIAWGSFVSILVLAAGLAPLRPALRWGGTAFVTAVQLMAFANFLPPAPERTDERAIAAELGDFDPGADTLLLGNQMLEPALRWHAPRAFEGAAYGFIYGDRNRNVIDGAMRSEFVRRADAARVEPGAGRLFVVREDPVPKERKVGPEDGVAGALDTVIGGRGPVRSATAGGLRLDVYDLN